MKMPFNLNYIYFKNYSLKFIKRKKNILYPVLLPTSIPSLFLLFLSLCFFLSRKLEIFRNVSFSLPHLKSKCHSLSYPYRICPLTPMDKPPKHYEFVIPVYLDKVGLTGEAQQGANNNLEEDGTAVRIGCGPVMRMWALCLPGLLL